MSRPPPRPIAFVLAATHQGTLIVNRNDYRLTERGGYGVGYQLLQTSSFDAAEVDFAVQLLGGRRRHVGDGVVALDCGANIGVHTLEWARAMTGWGQVIAVEAQERVFYALAGNLALNNCFNARAIWAAVGAQRGEMGVPVPDYGSPASFGSLELRKTARSEFIGQAIDYDEARLQTTAMMAIDDLALPRLDFLKIDIEGMELEALAGAEDTLARCRPVMMIEKIKTDEAALRSVIDRHGYRVFPMGINLLAVHGSDPLAGQIQIRQP